MNNTKSSLSNEDSQTMLVYSDHQEVTSTIIGHKWSLETHIKAVAAIMRATNLVVLKVQIF